MEWDLVIVERKLILLSIRRTGQTERSFFRRSFPTLSLYLTTPLHHSPLHSTTMAPKTPVAVSDAIKKLSASEQGQWIICFLIKGGEIASTVKFSVLFREYKN